MVNIVHIDVHCSDDKKITALELKIKNIAEEGKPLLDEQYLLATVSAAFYKTTLLADVGKSFRTITNSRRRNIVDIIIVLKKNNFSINDVANVVHAFQEALDSTSLI